MNEPVATLVLDEPLAALRADLERHDVSTRTVADFRLTSPLDPDVLRAVASGMGAAPWVLVTTNATLPDEHRSFEWERYAIAWIVVDPDLGGIAAEQAKADVVLRHREEMTRQRPGDLFTYTRFHRHRAPPSLGSTLRRSSPSHAGRRRGG